MRRLLTFVAVAAAALAVGTGTTVGNRILSLGNPKGLEQTTLSDRAYENKIARRVLFHEHPLFGVGWAPYGAQVAVSIGTIYTLQPRPFIHNQYYGVWLRGGLLALVAFVGALVAAGFQAAGTFRRDRENWVAAGALAALVGLAASAYVGIYVIDMASGVTLASVLGLASTLRPRTPSSS
jgi:O-antigen ligase